MASPLRIWTSVSNVRNIHIGFLVWFISAPKRTSMDTSFSGRFPMDFLFNYGTLHVLAGSSVTFLIFL
jgi:hypothetical protein